MMISPYSPANFHALWRLLKIAPSSNRSRFLDKFTTLFPAATSRQRDAVLELAVAAGFIVANSKEISITELGKDFAKASHWRLWTPPRRTDQFLRRHKIRHLFIPEHSYSNRPLIVDLFSGVGGLGLGFESAGFHVAAAVDNDPQACEAHRSNFPEAFVFGGDIRELTGVSRDQLCRRLGLDARKPVAGVVGGPPCQGFSYIGERVSTDERNLLTSSFINIVTTLKPDFFLLENVAGLQNSGIVPEFSTHLRRLAKPIGEPASAIVDLLPPIPGSIAKRDRQFRKRFVSEIVIGGKKWLKANVGKVSPKRDSTRVINGCYLYLLAAFDREIHGIYKDTDRSTRARTIGKIDPFVADLSVAIAIEFGLDNSTLEGDACEAFLKKVASSKDIEPTIRSRIRFITKQYDSAPKPSMRNGKKVGPILQHIMDRLSRDYILSGPEVISAAWHGTPQERRRLFILGVRKSNGMSLDFPKPTHRVGTRKSSAESLLPYVTSGEALVDLPDVDKFEELVDGDVLPTIHMKRPSSYGQLMALNGIEPDDLSLPRPDWDPFVLTSCKRTLHADHALARIRKTRQGTQDSTSHRTRLSEDKPSHTLRAGTREGKGSHTAVRPLHYQYDRVITVREGARLMGFPDWMKFHPTKWHGFRLVGNAVPSFLGRAIAKRIMEKLYGITGERRKLIA